MVALVAFNTTTNYNLSYNQGHGSRSSCRGNSQRGRGRGSAKSPPHYQLCQKDGHYATKCPDLHTFSSRPLDANLAEAFQSQCNLSSPIGLLIQGLLHI